MYIKTERLELKPLSDSDRDNMIELLTNSEIKKTYMLPDFENEEQAEKLFLRLKDGSRAEKVYQVGIFLNGEVIGYANEVERDGEVIELGYMIHPDHHNKGYGTEMLKAMIDEMLARGFKEVLAGAFEENPASMRIMEKSGMTRIEKTDDIEYRGKVHKCVYYAKRCDYNRRISKSHGSREVMKIELRERTEETVATYFEKAQDAEIKKVLPQKAQTLEEALEDYRQTLKADATSYGRTIYADGVYVGDIWCYGIDLNEEPNAMLSYCIFEKEYWKRGVASRAVQLFLADMIEKFSVETVGAFTYSSNEASIRVLEKNGFQEVEEFEEDGVASAYFQCKCMTVSEK